jgi:tetratricopeptide (TPR) repeat protein
MTRPRVLLIGWDAADWQLIDPLLRAGQMPALARFLAGGVRANLATLHPIISPILWNSIATGKLAEKHGILGFIEPDGKGGVRPVASTSRRAKAVWNILSQHGLRSTILGWFASAPAERINGAIVTDRYREIVCDHPGAPLDDRAIWPARLIQPLSELVLEADDITGETAAFFIPEIATVDPHVSPYPSALAKLVAECGTMHNAATYLLETEPFDFMAVYYNTIDHFGHAFMEFHPPAMEHTTPEEARLYGGVMNAAYRYHDLMLGRLLALAGPDTTVLLISDHGFHSGPLRPRLFVDREHGRKTGAGLNPVAWHRPFGVFAAAGPGIKKGVEINGITLLDLCPTVLTLLGLPVGEDMDGHPVLHMFEAPPPVTSVASYEPEHPGDGVHRGEMAEDSYSAHETLKQLADLGYIAPPTEDMATTIETLLRDRKSNLAHSLFAAHRLAPAEPLLRELVARAPSAKYRVRLAMCLAEQERFHEAEEILTDLRADPEEAPVATLLLAQIRYGQGRYDEAAAMAEKVAEFGVRFAGMYSQLGLIHLRRGRWPEAEHAFREALAIDADEVDVALRYQGRAEDAVYQHMRAVSLDAGRAAAHLNLGIALADVKRLDWAIRALETAASLAPDSPLPHRYLAQIYRRARHDPERARFHVRAALELRARANERNRAAFLARHSW